MPITSKLTDKAIRAAKPAEKPYKLSDGGGLYVLVEPRGSRLWRFKYRFGGKEKLLSFGPYPEITLSDARQEHQAAQRLLKAGKDPSKERQSAKQTVAEAAANDFESVAKRYIANRSNIWTGQYAGYVQRRLVLHIFPHLGKRPITDISGPDLLKVLQRIEKADAFEMAHRVRGLCSHIFRFARSEGIAVHNVATDLGPALTPHVSRPIPRANLEDMPKLLHDVDNAESAGCNRLTRLALQLIARTALRPGELRKGLWAEIDEKRALWRIPGERMKRKLAHIVPLSGQAIGILAELREITGAGKLMFPGEGSKRDGVMSENTMNQALHRLGWKDRHCAHGFRGVFSTAANEAGWNSDWIERALAHISEDEVRRAYNSAKYLPQRARLMAWYSDWLDELRKGEFVAPHEFRAREIAA
jgi:integrase